MKPDRPEWVLINLAPREQLECTKCDRVIPGAKGTKVALKVDKEADRVDYVYCMKCYKAKVKGV